MTKRKRNGNPDTPIANEQLLSKKIKVKETLNSAIGGLSTTVQIVAGSYDRVLHGITATISLKNEVEFADTFLFNAHGSAIRCLALSPPSAPTPGQARKVILATGSTDERVNLYHLSAHPPRKQNEIVLPSLTLKRVLENPQNRELGSLLHHSSSITALHFPTRSKLLSSAEDCTIAVTRTRDWSLLSTIKAPIPKSQCRPSGDTAPPGGMPAGINDFAVHPSLKLMISVGKGEKCMRLWNLVTGKRAGVLNFGREMLSEVGEGKYGSSEGRKVAWGSTDAGEEFCVAFERGVLVFGMDSRPKCKALPDPKTKLHQLRYVPISEDEESTILALSTEDGRILFYSTSHSNPAAAAAAAEEEEEEGSDTPIPSAKLIAQIGGRESGLSGRIKDFKVLSLDGKAGSLVIAAASSDGIIRLWTLDTSDLKEDGQGKVKQVGELVGAYETGHRITCLEAFVMIPGTDGASEEEAGDDNDNGNETVEQGDGDSNSESE